jgi:hypothetical protein
MEGMNFQVNPYRVCHWVTMVKIAAPTINNWHDVNFNLWLVET